MFLLRMHVEVDNEVHSSILLMRNVCHRNVLE